MKNLIRYSIIRFMPYSETQEFANVGVVVHAPESGDVEFKLTNKRFRRVSQFFDDLDGQLYSNAIEMFHSELLRIQEFSKGMLGKELATFMDEVTRQREGFLVFSKTAVLLTNHSIDSVLETLFSQYVGRNFNTKEHREALLIKNIKQQLDKVSKYKFTKTKLNADFVSFELPLVASDSVTTKAIKPLSFFQEKPLKLIDHGEFWISRIKHLLNSNTLNSNDFMFVIEHPKFKDRTLEKAFYLLFEEMQKLEVHISDANNIQSIRDFAKFDSEAVENFQLTH